MCVWFVFLVVLLGLGGCGVIVWCCWGWCSGVGLSGTIGLVSLFGLSGAVGLTSVCGHWSWASLEPNGLWNFIGPLGCAVL